MSEGAGDGGTVRVLRPETMRVGALRFRENVVTSMWFIPLVFVVAATALSFGTLAVDRQVTLEWSWLPGSTPNAAETLGATIAGGMLTFTGVVFSTTLVAIQLAGGQYSPRLVRVFVRSRVTHVALGVFLATFIVALNTLVQTREGRVVDVPTVTVLALYVMVLATIATFIVYIHSIVRLMRVQYLLRTVTAQGRDAIERFVPTDDAYRTAPAPPPDPSPALARNGSEVGVISAIDVQELASLAASEGCWIEFLVQPGEYLALQTPIARIHGVDADRAAAMRIEEHLFLGGERTLLQDPGFAFRQLADVACRALSPAVNDATTAVHAVDRITDLLAVVAMRPDPSGWYADEHGAPRVLVPEPGFARLAQLGYTEISLYGAGAPQVIRRLLAAFAVLEGITGGERARTVAALRARTLAAAEAHVPGPFHDVSTSPDRLGFG